MISFVRKFIMNQHDDKLLINRLNFKPFIIVKVQNDISSNDDDKQLTLKKTKSLWVVKLLTQLISRLFEIFLELQTKIV